MSGPLQSLADPMSTYNTSMRFIQEQRERNDAERRARVNKECEKALSSSSSEDEAKCECERKCKCKAEKLTPEEIRYREDFDRRFAEFKRKRRARWDEAHRKARKETTCTIL